MIKLSETLKKRELTKVKSERADLIKQLLEGINEERTKVQFYLKDGVKMKLKLLTAREVAIKVGHLKKLEDLRYLLSICKQGKSFTRAFFGSLKIKK